MNATAGEGDLMRVVLADANVLYSRVLRDYLLYAADQEIIAITWSPQILAETTEHLMKNVPGFDHAAATRLASAMNRAFPLAEVEPSDEDLRQLAGMQLHDEDDRHVLAAALTAEATVLCTSNTRDFPADVVEPLGVEVLTPDQLLSRLVTEFERRCSPPTAPRSYRSRALPMNRPSTHYAEPAPRRPRTSSPDSSGTNEPHTGAIPVAGRPMGQPVRPSARDLLRRTGSGSPATSTHGSRSDPSGPL